MGFVADIRLCPNGSIDTSRASIKEFYGVLQSYPAIWDKIGFNWFPISFEKRTACYYEAVDKLFLLVEEGRERINVEFEFKLCID